jgi:hypothetical protein
MTTGNERLEAKLDTVVRDIADIRVSHARMAESLEIHVKRTNLLEARVEQFGTRVKGLSMAASILGWLLATAATLVELWRGFHVH